MSLLTGTRCAVHPEDAAQQRCLRCGIAGCAQCAPKGVCARCAGEVAPSAQARRAASLSVGGLVATVVGVLATGGWLPPMFTVFWAVGILGGGAGLILSFVELGDIGRGQAPASGLRLAARARTVGLLNVALVLLFLMGVFVMGFIQGYRRVHP